MSSKDFANKKILMLIPNLGLGGAQRDFSKLALLLKEHYEVHVVVFNLKEGEAIYDLGVPVHDLKVDAGSNFISKIKRFLERLKKVKALKKQEKYAASISYLEGANYVNLLTKRGEKNVISVRGSMVHDSTITGKMGWVRKRFLLPWLYKKADVVVALNHGIKNELKDFLGVKEKKISVIYNHYDIAEISQQSKQELSTQEKDFFEQPTLVLSGRLALEKGFHHVLQVVALMQPKPHVLVMGEGPEQQKLIEECTKLSLSYTLDLSQQQGIVYFCGQQENVYKYLRRGRVLVISSTSEGGPNVMLEAMICGLPVVAVDCPYGPRERITDCSENKAPLKTRRGVLMPQFNGHQTIYQEWKEMLEIVLHDNEYLVEVSREAQTYIETFDLNKMKDRWQKVLE